MKNIIEKLKNELSTNELEQMANDVNSWNGYLEELMYFNNDEYFFRDFFDGKVDEAVRAVCYGDYEYMDDYVRFNAYGNLESCSEYEYEQEIEDNAEEIIEAYIDEIDNMCDDELKSKVKYIIGEE